MARPNSDLRKLRIALCHPDLGIGGAERVVVDAAVELTELGHSVHAFTAHHDPKHCFEETISGQFPVTVYGDFLPKNIFNRLYAVCAYIRCIYAAICMLLWWPAFDVVLVDQVSAVIPVLKLKKSKIIFYCHFPDLLLARHTTTLGKLYRKPIDWLEEITTGMADCVVVNSKFTANTFKQTFRSLDRKGIRPAVLYPAVDVRQPDSETERTELQTGSETNVLYFLSINRFERKKNIGLAISAFAQVVKNLEGMRSEDSRTPEQSSKDVRLVLAGGYDPSLAENREHLEELKTEGREKGIYDLVDFEPSCSTSKKNALLANCVCVIYTPTGEHFGIVPLEAMAAKKPVIACNSGGPKESIKHSVTGFLCEPTPSSFATAMQFLMRDPGRAADMGLSARAHVKDNFSRKVFGTRLNSIILDQFGS